MMKKLELRETKYYWYNEGYGESDVIGIYEVGANKDNVKILTLVDSDEIDEISILKKMVDLYNFYLEDK